MTHKPDHWLKAALGFVFFGGLALVAWGLAQMRRAVYWRLE